MASAENKKRATRRFPALTGFVMLEMAAAAAAAWYVRDHGNANVPCASIE